MKYDPFTNTVSIEGNIAVEDASVIANALSDAVTVSSDPNEAECIKRAAKAIGIEISTEKDDQQESFHE